MTTGKALDGKPYAANPHVRFYEGEVASAAMPWRGSLLCTAEKILAAPLSASRLFVASTAVLGAVFGAIADTTATYAKGDMTLSDGKVLIEYDGSENITKLAMAPGADEKLILTGDELSFAAGAQIAFSASGGGTNVIANSFTTAGALEFAGPTNMTWGGGAYLPMGDTYVTLFENVRLDDIVPIAGYGRMGNNTPTRDDSYKYTPLFIDRDDDNGKMRFELRNRANGTGDRSIFVEFAQDGDNIKGRVLESCYNSPADVQTRAFTYNNDGTVTVISGATLGNKRYIYQQQKWIDIGPRYGTPKLTVAMSENRTLPAVSGSGVDVTFDANAFGESALAFTSERLHNYRDANWHSLTTEHSLSEITLRSASVCGDYVPDAQSAIVFGWENNGVTASGQLQQSDGTYIRAVDIELRQNGEAVEIKWVATRILTSGGGNYYGKQKLTTSYKSLSYKQVRPYWVSTIANAVTSTASGANTMDGAFIVKGDDAHPIVYDVAAKYAMPETIDCYGNATLRFSASGAYNDGVSKNTDTITMHEGTTIATAGTYPFHYDSGDVVLDGATLSFTTGYSYLNFLTLMNGAKVDKSGGAINAGYQVDSPNWKITGTGKSTYTGDISIAAHSIGDNGTEKYLRIDVADTVEGDDTDFLLTGNISAWDDRKNASFSKDGPGTMEVDGTICTTNRAVRVAEGTLLLGRSGATAAEVDFSLQGGTLALADGTANTVDTVALTADSGISVASGASLTMADLTIADGKTLDIVGDGKVRVLASLDSATLSRIRLNGRRASQSSTGYLYVGGFVILFR